MSIPLLISFFAGVSVFVLFYLVNLKFKLDYVLGVYGIAIIVLGSFLMLYFADPATPEVSIVYYYVLVYSVLALLGYVSSLALVKLVLKK